jgi:hypothetical protein
MIPKIFGEEGARTTNWQITEHLRTNTVIAYLKMNGTLNLATGEFLFEDPVYYTLLSICK